MIVVKPITDIPDVRGPGQKWLFYTMESEQIWNVHVMHLKHLFNITATHRSDSDIYIPYGTPCKPAVWSNASLAETLHDPAQREQVGNIINNKTGLIAWMVSNCHTPSRREDFVAELRRYVRVDIYGKCGNMNCSKSTDARCLAMLNSKYKFYLAFENSLCQEYVTEKFLQLQNIDVVGVVRGVADYTRFAAPGTYIDVRDFPSIRSLAEYLIFLDSRPDLYMEYLLRKRSKIACEQEKVEPEVCRICKYIHAHVREQQRVDLSKFWNITKQCTTAKQFQLSTVNDWKKKNKTKL